MAGGACFQTGLGTDQEFTEDFGFTDDGLELELRVHAEVLTVGLFAFGGRPSAGIVVPAFYRCILNDVSLCNRVLADYVVARINIAVVIGQACACRPVLEFLRITEVADEVLVHVAVGGRFFSSYAVAAENSCIQPEVAKGRAFLAGEAQFRTEVALVGEQCPEYARTFHGLAFRGAVTDFISEWTVENTALQHNVVELGDFRHQVGILDSDTFFRYVQLQNCCTPFVRVRGFYAASANIESYFVFRLLVLGFNLHITAD